MDHSRHHLSSEAKVWICHVVQILWLSPPTTQIQFGDDRARSEVSQVHVTVPDTFLPRSRDGRANFTSPPCMRRTLMEALSNSIYGLYRYISV